MPMPHTEVGQDALGKWRCK